MDTAKDFFISYNSADKQMAEWIAWQLEEAGYTTVIQAWDFGPGQDFVLAMQKATSGANRTIALLSPNYLEAEYTAPEWAAALVQDPKGEQQKLVPIRVKPVEINGLLKSRVYIDLFNTDEDEAKDRLLNGIKSIGKRQKPLIAPVFPANDPPEFPIYNVVLDPNVNYINSNSDKTYLKAKPEYRTAQIDRIPQEDRFLELIQKQHCLSNGKTWGFVVHGPDQEWPTGMRYKLSHLISSVLADDDNFLPSIEFLTAKVRKANKSAQDWLWSLFKETLNLEGNSFDKWQLAQKLEEDRLCYIFIRELSSEESTNEDFVAEMLWAWQAIELGEQSKSHFLLLVNETPIIQSKPKRWWSLSKIEITWEEKLTKAFVSKEIPVRYILPSLQSPEWTHIKDWLRDHFVDEHENKRRQIIETLEKEFPNVSAIPHEKLKAKLLPHL